MAYLLLLALVYTFAFALLLFLAADQQRSAATASLGLGFLFLALGYSAQIVLGFELNEGAARLFYWARTMLSLAWLGHGFLLSSFPDKKVFRGASKGLILASFVALGLVSFTQITNAEDWFQPSRTIYGQISDLLATNRPTRWLSLAMNMYGLAGLLGSGVYLAGKERKTSTVLRALLMLLGALVIVLPLYLAPIESEPTFFLLELFAPIVLFLALPFSWLQVLTRRAMPRKVAA